MYMHACVVDTFTPLHPLPRHEQGYLPANIDRREETLQRKRQEYRNFIDQYYHMKSDPLHVDTFRQVCALWMYSYYSILLCVRLILVGRCGLGGGAGAGLLLYIIVQVYVRGYR